MLPNKLDAMQSLLYFLFGSVVTYKMLSWDFYLQDQLPC